MSEEEETFIVSMKVKYMPNNPIPSMKMTCSGGCGDEVWVDKNLERLWSKIPVLCMECALEKMGSSREDISFAVAPESIESLMKFMVKESRKKSTHFARARAQGGSSRSARARRLRSDSTS